MKCSVAATKIIAGLRRRLETAAIALSVTFWLISHCITPARALDYSLTLNGYYETPRNNSTNFGVGYAYTAGNWLFYYILAIRMQPTAAAIFGPAPAGSNGPFITDLTNNFPDSPYPDTTEYTQWIELTDEQLEQLNEGLWYVNISSSNYPLGELRGQLCPQTDDGDCDGDGVPNILDHLCPQTLPGSPVNSIGCTIFEEVPCNGPWRDRKEYVEAFRDAAMRFWKEGKLTVKERNALIKKAEESDCGHPYPLPIPLEPGN